MSYLRYLFLKVQILFIRRVYLLYCEDEIVGVFSSIKKAKAYKSHLRNTQPEYHDFDIFGYPINPDYIKEKEAYKKVKELWELQTKNKEEAK